MNPTAGGRAIAWNHDGQMIAIADYEGVLTIWSKQGTLISEGFAILIKLKSSPTEYEQMTSNF